MEGRKRRTSIAFPTCLTDINLLNPFGTYFPVSVIIVNDMTDPNMLCPRLLAKNFRCDVDTGLELRRASEIGTRFQILEGCQVGYANHVQLLEHGEAGNYSLKRTGKEAG